MYLAGALWAYDITRSSRSDCVELSDFRSGVTQPSIRPADPDWTAGQQDTRRAELAGVVDNKRLPTSRISDALRALIRSGDRVFTGRNNQKQTDFSSRSLAALDPGDVHTLHLLFSSISRPEHLDMLESGPESDVDFCLRLTAEHARSRVVERRRAPYRIAPHLP